MGDLVFIVECRIFDEKLADGVVTKAREESTTAVQSRPSLETIAAPEVTKPESSAEETGPQLTTPSQRVLTPDDKPVEIIPADDKSVEKKTVDPDEVHDHSTFHTIDGKPLIALLFGKHPAKRLAERSSDFALTSVVEYGVISVCYYRPYYLIQSNLRLTGRGYVSFEQALRAEAYRRTRYRPRAKPNGDLSVKIRNHSFLLKPRGKEGKPILVIQPSEKIFSFSKSNLMPQKTTEMCAEDYRTVMKPVSAARRTEMYNALLQSYMLRFLQPVFRGRS